TTAGRSSSVTRRPTYTSVVLSGDGQHGVGVHQCIVGRDLGAELDDERHPRWVVRFQLMSCPWWRDAGVGAAGHGRHREAGELGVPSPDGARSALAGGDRV